MSEWLEFRYVNKGKERPYCVNAYDVRGFSDTGEGTTDIVLDRGECPVYITVANSYDEVKRMVLDATEPKYQVQITEPKEDNGEH